MPKGLSMKARQQAVLDSGFIDLMGENQFDFVPLDLDNMAGTLADIALRLIEIARDNLQKGNRIATGALADSIVPSEVEIFGSVYRVEIKLADYYDFVNKGVKGWQDEKGGNSPYKFKNTKPSKKMVEAIRKWVIKEGLKGRGRENRKNVGIRDRKRHSITDTSTSTAYAISSAVKKKGLRPSHFLDAAVKQMERDVAEEFSKALKIDIINNLTAK